MEESKKSQFNAGVAQTERIDQLQTTMNLARFNPLIMNPQFGKYNYEVMITCLDGLFAESWAKLNSDEKDEGNRIKNLIHNFTRMKPLIINDNGKTGIHNENYIKFLDLIDIYEKKIKIFLDEHDLNSPNAEDDEGL